MPTNGAQTLSCARQSQTNKQENEATTTIKYTQACGLYANNCNCKAARVCVCVYVREIYVTACVFKKLRMPAVYLYEICIL